MGLARDRFAFRADWFRNCIENPVLAAERRQAGGLRARGAGGRFVDQANPSCSS